jgi:hypothetical protein
MGTYGPPVDQFLNRNEDPVLWRDWPDYLGLGIGPEHIPDLIRMATDPELNDADFESREVWAPVHAWRTLGQLRAEAAVAPLIEMLADLTDEGSDDWAFDELPRALGMIGPAAIPGAAGLLEDESAQWAARSAAGRVLEEVGTRYPEAREECVAILTRTIERAGSNPPDLNGFLVDHLMNLRAREAAGVIERAFAGGFVDESIVGTWYDVWHELDLEGEPPTRPERPRFADRGAEDDWPDDFDEGAEDDWPDEPPHEPKVRYSWEPIESRTPEERKDRNQARKKLEQKLKGKKGKKR